MTRLKGVFSVLLSFAIRELEGEVEVLTVGVCVEGLFVVPSNKAKV